MKTETHFIDINCDLGEGIGNDADLMPYISSCNLACGAHAGDIETIRKVISLAKENNVGVGAHPSIPDRVNFGRLVINMPLDELKTSVLKQIDLIASECRKQRVPLHHIKTHGALYNLCAKDEKYAEMITQLLADFYPKTPIYAPYNSVMSKIASGRIPVIFEAFADRNYEADGSLVSRSNSEATINDKKALLEHVLGMVLSKKIKTVSGPFLKVEMDTICVHGDTPKAVELVKFLNTQLTEVGIKINTAI